MAVEIPEFHLDIIFTEYPNKTAEQKRRDIIYTLAEAIQKVSEGHNKDSDHYGDFKYKWELVAGKLENSPNRGYVVGLSTQGKS